MASSQILVTFNCSECHAYILEPLDDLPSFDYLEEVNSDGIGVAEYYITCPQCEEEYQIELTNKFDNFDVSITNNTNVTPLLEYSDDIQDEYDEFDYDAYLKSYVPDDPFRRYNHSLRLLDEMILAAGTLSSYPMFQRMLLLQHVAMMEAYLCDRLITLTTVIEIRKNLIKNHQKLGSQKYTLEAISGNNNLIQEKTNNYLKNQLYHELDEVENLYMCALGKVPFINENSKQFLKSVMINRHHCVHRDGKDNDGSVLHDVDSSYIEKVRFYIRDLVLNIENQYSHEIKLWEDITPL